MKSESPSPKKSMENKKKIRPKKTKPKENEKLIENINFTNIITNNFSKVPPPNTLGIFSECFRSTI